MVCRSVEAYIFILLMQLLTVTLSLVYWVYDNRTVITADKWAPEPPLDLDRDSAPVTAAGCVGVVVSVDGGKVTTLLHKFRCEHPPFQVNVLCEKMDSRYIGMSSSPSANVSCPTCDTLGRLFSFPLLLLYHSILMLAHL